MRFAKRNRGWLAGRRLFGSEYGGESSGVASEERSALLDNDADVGEGVIGEPAPASMGDPTHRLLTALGRFQRQVSRAESGALQSQWCDECMNQIIAGIELSMTQGWNDVTQALTDTARVLHSYERVERAQQCVSFLQDSYEILCLMVGDLIVDNVRSGVMQKWRERFRRAVEDMQHLGISLVEDDGDAEEEIETAVEMRGAAPAVAAQEPEEQGSLFELTDSNAEDEEEAEAVANAPAADPVMAPAFVEPGLTPASAEDSGNLPALGDLLEEEQEEEEEETEETQEEPEPGEEEPVLEDTGVFEPAGETREEGDGEEIEEEIVEEADLLSLAESPEEVTPFEEPAAIVASAETAVEEGPPPLGSPAHPVAKPAAIPVAAPAAPRTGAAAAETLLQHTRQAISSGNVADAKLLALELAINMARLEAQRVEEQVGRAEALLTQNETSIAEAEEAVRQEEQEVTAAEERVTGRERELGECRAQLSRLHEQVAAIQGVIEGIDEEIRKLEERRQAEVERLAAVRDEQEEALAHESRIQTEIEHLNDTAQAAHETLEESRNRVSRLRKERTEHDSDLQSALVALEQRKQAVSQIAQTIESIRVVMGGAPVGPVPAEPRDELF
ncbi:MAG: hypothetical protein KA184_02645 [Candidatus Hydrogenedentes bacterium]|nr:hypothetical protein [Candidatus Hydrogenedentota bacterium]